MKKISLFLLMGIFSILFSSAQEGNRMKFLLDKLYDGGKSGYVMIFAHRGDWRNSPENSIKAFQNCIDAGIDGIEIDIQATKDGELIIMHDKTLDRTTNGSGDVADKTLTEIKELYLRNPIKVITTHRIPTFREVLKATKGKILIHVDKWPPHKDKILKIAEEEDCLNQIIFRSTRSSEDIKERLGDYYDRINYIPVIVCKNNNEDMKKLDDILKNLKASAIGISFRNEDAELLKHMDVLKAAGYRIWFNTMWAEFNAGHDDQLAEYDLEESYGWLINKGANILFTDRPFLLSDYLKSKGKR